MNSMACALKRSRRKRNPYARLSRFQKKSVRLNFLARCSLSLHYKILLLPCTLVHRNASYSRFALSLITTLFLRAFEIGHPDSAVFQVRETCFHRAPELFLSQRAPSKQLSIPDLRGRRLRPPLHRVSLAECCFSQESQKAPSQSKMHGRLPIVLPGSSFH